MRPFACALGLAALLMTEAFACTIVTATTGEAVLLAANEDQPPNKTFLVVDATGPRGVVFLATPTAWAPLVMQMGINDQGLSYSINAIPEEKLTRVPGATPQQEWALVKLMREVGTVQELLDNYFAYDWGPSIAYQVHVADRSGDAAVIHPGADGRLSFTRIDRQQGHLISTNFNLRDRALKQWLSPRQLSAQRKFDGLTARPTPEFMAAVLEATHQTPGWISNTRTIFSAVFNLQTLDIHLYNDSDFGKRYVLNARSALAQVSGQQIRPLAEVLHEVDQANPKAALPPSH
ncbi:MAG: hypothetical protein EOP39_08360 [Rubrivivax sp.]|nr:MAG: hypothetical protein EOP39_08360 [Rubrivivax sp.]